MLTRRSETAAPFLRWYPGLLGAALSLTLPAAAEAHAPPQATGIFPVLGSSEVARWVRTNRGLITFAGEAAEPRLLCHEAYGAVLSETPPLIVGPAGALVATFGAGIVRVAPDGCSATPVQAPLGERRVLDMAISQDGSRHYLLISPSATEQGALLTSDDDGSTFTEAAALDVFGTALRISPSNPERIYVTAQRETEDGQPAHELLVSTDDGTTFKNLVVELLDSEVRAFVLAVDPTDEQRVFLRTLAGNPDDPERLLLSEDGGESFSVVFEGVGPLAFAIDETNAWVGGRDGVARSADRGKSFQVMPDAPTLVGCLVAEQGSLSVCGYQDNEFGVVRLAADGQSFVRDLKFSEVTQQVACPADAPVLSSCGPVFQHWLEEVSGVAPLPVGPSPGAGGSIGGSAAEPTKPASTSSCQLGAAPIEGAPLALLLLGGFWAVRAARVGRRRRRAPTATE